MRTVLERELIVIARHAAVAVACVVTGLGLVAFILAWPRGVPLAQAPDPYAQTRTLASLLLSVILPWASVRAASPERGDTLVLLAAFLDVRTSSLVAAKVVAHSLVLALIVLMAYPALLMAQQAAAVPLLTTVVDECALGGVAILGAGLATGCSLLLPHRLGAWLLATIVSMLVVVVSWWSVPDVVFVGATSALTGLAAACAAAAWSSSALMYLRDGDA